MGKNLERFFSSERLLHLAPDFPTFIGRQSCMTPDIILSNNKVMHNIIFKPESLTESRHVPMIITLTTRAITKPTQDTLDLKNANWEKFKEEMNTGMDTLNLAEQMNQKEVDKKLKEL